MSAGGAEPTAVFFDIDGTIWNFRNEIPESTRVAIRTLRENGHLAFLCSGRSRGYIRSPELLGLGFDGIVSGCGTLLEYRGQTLFYYQIPASTALRAVSTVRAFGFRPILEGKEYIYFDDADFAGDRYGDKLRRDLGPRLRSISDNWGTWEISKLACDTKGCDQAAGLSALQEDFDAIIHNAAVVELTPKGFHKGAGIQRMCAHIGHDIRRTVAFGDSVNDLEMFSVCGTSVAMGNGVEAAKQAADFVTSPMDQDGIWNGCKTLGLI